MGYRMGLYEYLYKFSPEQIDPEFDRLLSMETLTPSLSTMTDIIGKLDLDKGVAFGKRIHERFPDDLEATFVYARRLRFANLYEESIAQLETLTEEQLLRPDIGLLYSDALYMNQDYKASIQHLLDFEDNTDEEYKVYNRDRDYRLNTRPKMIELWSNEQAIRMSQQNKNPLVRMTIDGKPIVIELYAENAPTTVSNFIALINAGFYSDTPFHSVRAGFISQGGVPKGETFPSYAGPGYSIEDESDRADARLHFAGSIAMAKISKDELFGSQFYITHTPTHHLNGKSPVFGHVVEGMDIVRAMRGGEHIDLVEVISLGSHESDAEFKILTPEGETVDYGTWKSGSADADDD